MTTQSRELSIVTDKTAIYGADGFGREVLHLIRRLKHIAEDIVFVDDDPTKQGGSIAGVKIISFQEAFIEGRDFVIAVADSFIREKLAAKVTLSGRKFRNVIAASAIVSDEAIIGEGLILCENTIITANALIGKHFHANIYSYVAHDCVIGDYVTFGPRVSCNGRILVGSGAYIGTSAVIKQGRHHQPLSIGKNSIVGMGAVVTKDVAEGMTVIGNPARALESKT